MSNEIEPGDISSLRFGLAALDQQLTENLAAIEAAEEAIRALKNKNHSLYQELSWHRRRLGELKHVEDGFCAWLVFGHTRSHPCDKKAKPGDRFCGIHRNVADKRSIYS